MSRGLLDSLDRFSLDEASSHGSSHGTLGVDHSSRSARRAAAGSQY
jgi:hypothetical protein